MSVVSENEIRVIEEVVAEVHRDAESVDPKTDGTQNHKSRRGRGRSRGRGRNRDRRRGRNGRSGRDRGRGPRRHRGREEAKKTISPPAPPTPAGTSAQQNAPSQGGNTFVFNFYYNLK
ncbi:splicing factor U2af large subunit B-like [Photinus pyralis]|uniref:splicing factor U2af large subunit B-like n=1 Tax=Photinus pyralis TaxID=7054 RepID=UPI00126731EF|nr:splicing factor U2af large subunit B-like [Photinus pyralis]